MQYISKKGCESSDSRSSFLIGKEGQLHTYPNHSIAGLHGEMMEKIEWTSALSVGVPEIDEQHQRLYGIIDDLLKTQEQDPDEPSLLALLAKLVDYSDYHFRTEDNYMIENNYPLFLSHRKEHLAYIKKMGTFINAIEKKEKFLLQDILDFLCDWWQNHIINSDLKYARYIKSQQ